MALAMFKGSHVQYHLTIETNMQDWAVPPNGQAVWLSTTD